MGSVASCSLPQSTQVPFKRGYRLACVCQKNCNGTRLTLGPQSMRGDSATERATRDGSSPKDPVRSKPPAYSGGGDFRGHRGVLLFAVLLRIGILGGPCR